MPLVRDLPTALKLHILYYQSLIYERSGQIKLLKQVLKKGTDFVEFPDWYQFFLLELARILSKEGNDEEAVEMLTKGLVNAEETKATNVVILFQLTLAQRHSSRNEHSKVKEMRPF